MSINIRAAAAAATLIALSLSAADAAVIAPGLGLGTEREASSVVVEQIQHRNGGRVVIVPPRAYIAPRPYLAPRPYAYRGPTYAYTRPWYRRPHFGTIIGGIALGTIIGVTAYGLVPPRPRPDLCWYWLDDDRSQGYWDYC